MEPLATIGTHSGGHIHIGTQTLGSSRESWFNFIKIWSVYENIIFRFLYGEFLTARPSLINYAAPMSKIFWRDYEILKNTDAELHAIISRLKHGKFQAVNFYKVYDFDHYGIYNTIEFRCPNGSLDPVIWQNNVNLLVKMLTYVRSTTFNDDLVQQRRLLNLEKFSELKFYNEIYLEQALELCDMVFTNNFDKVYFLRQYLKSFQVSEKVDDYSKALKFTKVK